MTRGMNSMPTYRQGRTQYRPGANDRGGLGGVCGVIVAVLLVCFPPILLLGSERVRRGRYLTLGEALDSDIVDLNDVDLMRTFRANPTANGAVLFPTGSLVHGTSSDIDTVATDAANRISIPGALKLRRETEYCQWQEIQSQRCQTCYRTVSAKDGSTKEESYQCNCVTQFSYIKTWMSRRTSSLLFDQPAAHYNPMRDPMPSATLAAEGATLAFDEHFQQPQHQQRKSDQLQAVLDPSMLSNSVRNQPWRLVNFVRDGRAPPPSFFASFIPASWLPVDRTRYEPLSLLRDTPRSDAAVKDNFAFVGQGGYFFSPYETTTANNVMKWFVQYLEGSLLDWQLGDLMPSCTAGDVRFRYRVQDPLTVSVLGQALPPSFAEDVLTITPSRMSHERGGNENSLGLVYAGVHSAINMLQAEDSDSRMQALIPRLLLMLWSIPVSRLIGAALHRNLSSSTTPVQVMAAMGVWASFVGVVWTLVWGLALHGRDTLFLLFVGGTLAYLGYRSSNPSAGRSGSLTAVWCMIGRWANAPPGWRVEESYRPVAESGGSGDERKEGYRNEKSRGDAKQL